MRAKGRLALAMVAATAFLSLAISSASARRIEISEPRFRIVWAAFTVAGNGVEEVRCPVTLEGSLHSRTISKLSGDLIGYVTHAAIASGSCTGGTAAFLTESLPWHIQYLGFSGTLPNITTLRWIVVGLRYQLVVGGFTCLTGSTQSSPAGINMSIASGVMRTATDDETLTIPLEGVCSFVGSDRLKGTAEVFALGSTTTRITVRLVQ